GEIHDVLRLAKIIRGVEPRRESEFVVGVQRRSVASSAALLLENDLSAAGAIIEWIWIGRRLQGIKIQDQSVQLLVAESDTVFAKESLAGTWLEIAIISHHVQRIIHSGITHQVTDGSVTHQSR